MLDHPQEAQRLGAKGKDLVNTQYGLERMVRDTEAVYDEVLGG
jgi:hypothetical protein